MTPAYNTVMYYIISNQMFFLNKGYNLQKCNVSKKCGPVLTQLQTS